MSKLVKIACSIPNGISLRLWKKGFDDGTGFQPMIPDGPPVMLAGVSAIETGAGQTERTDLPVSVTEVDSVWWAAWLAQNQKNPMVTMDMIREIKEEGPAAGDQPAPIPTE